MEFSNAIHIWHLSDECVQPSMRFRVQSVHKPYSNYDKIETFNMPAVADRRMFDR